MNPHTNESTHHIYDFGLPCLTLLSSCIRIIYDNYNTIEINEAFINNLFAIILQLLYWIFLQVTNLLLLLINLSYY
jgi:hypothetical protein